MKRGVLRGCHIARMLRRQKRHISFHTPGHKRAGADITELPYSDNLLSPTGVLAEAEADIARILGADASFLLTDGSTCGVFSMLYAVRCAGARAVAVPAYAHRSVFNACGVMGLEPVVMAQPVVRGIPAQPSAEEAARALARADALLFTSPDYYGFLPELARAKALCAAAGKPLLLDGAHGSHLKGTPAYAGNFADLWVDGVHKSLPALTQGAVVSAKGAWAERLRDGVRVFRTSSPSYPVMASVEYAVRYPENVRLERAVREAKRAAGALGNDDWTKIVVPFGNRADEAEAYLTARGVYCEFNDGNYLMFYLSSATKLRELKKLTRLLARLPRGEVADEAPIAGMGGGETVLLPLERAVGRTCARDCGRFPPCMPLIRRGERVTAEKAENLRAAANTYGLTDGMIEAFSRE